jgi:hypothetical protein
MKIAVLGSGTVGVMSVCHFLKYLPEAEITCIYNPDKNILGIGESSNVQLPALLWHSVNFNVFIDSKELSSTIKLGVLYKNWRKKEFINPILPTNYAMHFDNFKLSKVIFDRCKKIYKNRFKILHKEIKELIQFKDKVKICFNEDKKEYDYVIDCRGYPEDYSNYHMCTSLPLNRCFVNMIPEPGNFSYTYHYAHKNGWMFGIPLSHRQGWGYLFNDEITSEQEAIDDINEIFKSNKKKEDLRNFKFKPYRTKKFLEGRIIKNGNRAIFYEPMEALSGVYYDIINRSLFDHIKDGVSEPYVNEYLDLLAQRYENFICYVYNQGSIYKTKFWKQVKKSTDKHLKNNQLWEETLNSLKETKEDTTTTWPFAKKSWKILKDNFKC